MEGGVGGLPQRSLNARHIVCHDILCRKPVIRSPMLAEVNPTNELAHNHHIYPCRAGVAEIQALVRGSGRVAVADVAVAVFRAALLGIGRTCRNYVWPKRRKARKLFVHCGWPYVYCQVQAAVDKTASALANTTTGQDGGGRGWCDPRVREGMRARFCLRG